MKRFKKTIALLSGIYLVLSLAACSSGKEEYESVQGFEFHFYPEEYAKEYSEVSKTLTLEPDTDYQLQINATCESGTMKIIIIYANDVVKTYNVYRETPCNELLILSANTGNEISITVSIESDTKGKIIGDLLAKEEEAPSLFFWECFLNI